MVREHSFLNNPYHFEEPERRSPRCSNRRLKALTCLIMLGVLAFLFLKSIPTHYEPPVNMQTFWQVLIEIINSFKYWERIISNQVWAFYHTRWPKGIMVSLPSIAK